jgi:REP element-mobilizing transposase RayT
MNRGRNRDLIYLDDYDAGLFLMMIESTIDRFNVEVHAYSLMPNHYHLLVRTPLGNLSQAMRYLGASYTQAFNKRHGKDGALFKGRFRSQLVEDEQYLTYLLSYIHLNPVRAGLIRRLDGMEAWTGHRRYMGLDTDPSWLSTDELLMRFGSREKLKENMASLRHKDHAWPNGMNLTEGWLSNVKPSNQRSRAERETAVVVTVDQLLKEIAQVVGVEEQHLQESVKGPGGNVARRFAVWALHAATCMSHREIGHALGMRPEMAAKTLSRSKENKAQFGDWPDKWLEMYPQKVSSVDGLLPKGALKCGRLSSWNFFRF